MKKIYTLALGLAVSTAALAQNKVAGNQFSGNVNFNKEAAKTTAQTQLLPPSFSDTCFANDPNPLTTYLVGAANGGGYTTGNNGYGDLEKAQKFNITGQANVLGVLITQINSLKTGTTGATTMKIYGVSATTKGPNATTVGTSDVRTLASMTADTVFYYFPTAPFVAGSFFASLILPTAAGDTMALACTKDGCFSGDSLAWEKWSDNSWWAWSNGSSWGQDVDLAISPIVDLNNSIKNSIDYKGLTVYGATPNPANSEVTLTYSLNSSSNVTVEIVDMTGRTISTIKNSNVAAGKQIVNVDLKNYAAGTYTYFVQTNTARLASRFVVTK